MNLKKHLSSRIIVFTLGVLGFLEITGYQIIKTRPYCTCFYKYRSRHQSRSPLSPANSEMCQKLSQGLFVNRSSKTRLAKHQNRIDKLSTRYLFVCVFNDRKQHLLIRNLLRFGTEDI